MVKKSCNLATSLLPFQCIARSAWSVNVEMWMYLSNIYMSFKVCVITSSILSVYIYKCLWLVECLSSSFLKLYIQVCRVKRDFQQKVIWANVQWWFCGRPDPLLQKYSGNWKPVQGTLLQKWISCKLKLKASAFYLNDSHTSESEKFLPQFKEDFQKLWNPSVASPTEINSSPPFF